jgi:hypothetical protein
MCCARAIVTAKARLDNDPQWEAIRKGDKQRYTLQRRLAQQLMKDAGLEDFDGPCGLTELDKFQAVLSPDYQIKVYGANETQMLVYKGIIISEYLLDGTVYLYKNILGFISADKVVNLFFDEGHYDVITSMPAMMGNRYWCEACNKGYDHREDHACERGECPCCNGTPKCEPRYPYIGCKDCNRYFANKQCFDNHKTTSKGENKEDGRKIM